MASRKKPFKIIFYIALLVSVSFYVVSLFNQEIFGDVGGIILILGIVAAIISYESPTKFNEEFGEDDWTYSEENNEYFIYIPENYHGMGKDPLIQCSMKDEGNMNEIFEGGLKYNRDGNVWVTSNSRVECRVTIFN